MFKGVAKLEYGGRAKWVQVYGPEGDGRLSEYTLT